MPHVNGRLAAGMRRKGMLVGRLMLGKRAQVARGSGPCDRGDSGLTLIELLVVLGILALFASLAVPQVTRYLGSARTETARTQIQSLVTAVELYYLDVGSYPSQEAGLIALFERPQQSASWRGPYLKKESALRDPWGRPYQYRAPGQKGEFDILTYGRDGQPGGTGEDVDVTSWK